MRGDGRHDGEPGAGRLVVVRGRPSDDEVAALTVALHRHRRATTRDAPRRTSRWIRAARLEARGHPPITSPARLQR